MCFCYCYENSLGANNSSRHRSTQDLLHTKKHTLYTVLTHTQTHTYIYINTHTHYTDSTKWENTSKTERRESSRISSKSRISHEFVSCTIFLHSLTPLTNHYPTLPSAIDKNVTVRFYPWPHRPRGYYPPYQITSSCH